MISLVEVKWYLNKTSSRQVLEVVVLVVTHLRTQEALQEEKKMFLALSENNLSKRKERIQLSWMIY
jgi:hypothetical protein